MDNELENIRNRVTDFCNERGLSSFLGEQIVIYNRATKERQQSSLSSKTKRCIAMIRKMAKDQEINIDDVILPREKRSSTGNSRNNTNPK